MLQYSGDHLRPNLQGTAMSKINKTTTTTNNKSSNPTRIDLKPKLRERMIALLNQQLADTADLYSQVKQAHWNVKGPYFIALHELFDSLAEGIEEPVDTIAERVTALGGVAMGTARLAARNSRLPELPHDSYDGMKMVALLADRYALLGASTSDLFTAVSRELDKSLWFLEAHLQ
jgi:starvation-inducible DNA-binding protein